MQRLFGRGIGCAVYFDESCSVVDKKNTVWGFGAIVANDSDPVRLAIQDFVAALSKSCTPEEFIKGEPKGAKLRPERFTPIIDFFHRTPIALCVEPFINRADGTIKKVEASIPVLLEHLRKPGQPWGKRGESFAAAFESASNEDRVYALCMQHFFRGTLVRTFSLDVPAYVQVVLDKKLDPQYEAMLHFAVGTGLASKLPPGFAWNFRQLDSRDEPALRLTDWLVYPFTAMNRPDLPEPRRRLYLDICKQFDSPKLIRSTGTRPSAQEGQALFKRPKGGI